MIHSQTQRVLEFWFSEDARDKWFAKDQSFDEEIRTKFLALYEKTKTEQMLPDDPKGLLALIIVLDQFPRNMFRGQAASFATDSIALTAAKAALRKSYGQHLNNEQRRFLYMPFMHSENIEDQKKGVKLFQETGDLEGASYAIQHQKIIERFSRFPHRNDILNRPSTSEELQFLKEFSGF